MKWTRRLILFLAILLCMSFFITKQVKKDNRIREANRKASEEFYSIVQVGKNRDIVLQEMSNVANWTHVQCRYWDHSGAIDLFYFRFEEHYSFPYEVLSNYVNVGDKFVIKSIGIVSYSLCVENSCLPPDIEKYDFDFSVCE